MTDAIHNTSIDTPKRFQCRHIHIDGRRCVSPCLRHEEFCYYHHTSRKPVARTRARRSRQAAFDLPLPEDRSAIQLSIGEVLRRIASNTIDPRRAGLLLYRSTDRQPQPAPPRRPARAGNHRQRDRHRSRLRHRRPPRRTPLKRHPAPQQPHLPPSRSHPPRSR